LARNKVCWRLQSLWVRLDVQRGGQTARPHRTRRWVGPPSLHLHLQILPADATLPTRLGGEGWATTRLNRSDRDGTLTLFLLPDEKGCRLNCRGVSIGNLQLELDLGCDPLCVLSFPLSAEHEATSWRWWWRSYKQHVQMHEVRTSNAVGKGYFNSIFCWEVVLAT
jgi:hypothetical protein